MKVAAARPKTAPKPRVAPAGGVQGVAAAAPSTKARMAAGGTSAVATELDNQSEYSSYTYESESEDAEEEAEEEEEENEKDVDAAEDSSPRGKHAARR